MGFNTKDACFCHPQTNMPEFRPLLYKHVVQRLKQSPCTASGLSNTQEAVFYISKDCKVYKQSKYVWENTSCDSQRSPSDFLCVVLQLLRFFIWHVSLLFWILASSFFTLVQRMTTTWRGMSPSRSWAGPFRIRLTPNGPTENWSLWNVSTTRT